LPYTAAPASYGHLAEARIQPGRCG
jgi:hypothetical protein